MRTVITLLAAIFIAAGTSAHAAKPAPKAEGYVFTDVKTVPVTSVKNQASSGTCWSFSGLAFLESEILSAGGADVDLSPMYVVRQAYHDRAVKYVRMHGESSLSSGAAAEDVIICWREHGIVPTEVYKGLEYGEDIHRHAELDAVVKGYCDAVIAAGTLKPGAPRTSAPKLSTAWMKGLDAILDSYLGKVPETFTYNDKEYTPESFAKSLPIDIEDYVSITSFTHHPFNTWFIVEVPDNTVWGRAFNVPLDEMITVIDDALAAGHPLVWAADVSEGGFAWRNGYAVVPDGDATRLDDSEQARWVSMTQAEKDAAMLRGGAPGREKNITQQMRQTAFDNWETTDDHGMVIVGTATDQTGARYYKIKNSWGAQGHIYGGYFYASKPFVEYKTMSVMLNKKVLPAHLLSKM